MKPVSTPKEQAISPFGDKMPPLYSKRNRFDVILGFEHSESSTFSGHVIKTHAQFWHVITIIGLKYPHGCYRVANRAPRKSIESTNSSRTLDTEKRRCGEYQPVVERTTLVTSEILRLGFDVSKFGTSASSRCLSDLRFPEAFRRVGPAKY